MGTASASSSIGDPDDQSGWADQKKSKGKNVKPRMRKRLTKEVRPIAYYSILAKLFVIGVPPSKG